jgi:hypothetical protein
MLRKCWLQAMGDFFQLLIVRVTYVPSAPCPFKSP